MITQIRVIIVVLLTLLFASCTFFKVIYHNFSGVDDFEIFLNRELKPSKNPYYFKKKLDDTRIPEKIKNTEGRKLQFEEFLISSETLAFLVIKNDTLLFEKYYNGHKKNSLSLSFSMSKSFLSILIGIAIDDGLIKSVDVPVTDFIPELSKFKNVHIKHLLQMTSGMDYTDSDSPFATHPGFYYGKNLEERILDLGLEEEPGRRFKYKSGENQLLGLILSRALKKKTITEYMQEKIWNPVGMEFSGLWSIDQEKNGLEKTFCCISARARDFAKLGRLYLRKGNWESRKIVSQDWVEQSTKIDTSDGSAWYYQYQWWIVSKEDKDYLAKGHLGQYVYVNPKKELIIVRLGRSSGENHKAWQDIFRELSKRIK